MQIRCFGMMYHAIPMVAIIVAASSLTSSAADFPFSQKSKDDVGGPSGFAIETKATAFEDGTVDVQSTMIDTNSVLGFTGGVQIFLADENGKPIAHSEVKTRGVNTPGPDLNPFDDEVPESTAPLNFKMNVPAEEMANVEQIRIVHSHEPNVEMIKDRVDKLIEAGQTVAEIIAAIKPIL